MPVATSSAGAPSAEPSTTPTAGASGSPNTGGAGAGAPSSGAGGDAIATHTAGASGSSSANVAMPSPATAVATLMPIEGGAATGSTAGALSGTATFTKRPFGIELALSVMGCTAGASYSVQINQGPSCADVVGRGEPWGAAGTAANAGAAAANTMTAGVGGAVAGAGGAGGTAADSSSAGAGGTGGAAAGASGSATGAVQTVRLRGGSIPDLVCDATGAMLMYVRSTPDVRVVWTIGGDPQTDVVGHVLILETGSAQVACGEIVAQ